MEFIDKQNSGCGDGPTMCVSILIEAAALVEKGQALTVFADGNVRREWFGSHFYKCLSPCNSQSMRLAHCAAVTKSNATPATGLGDQLQIFRHSYCLVAGLRT